jgi:hypothetical protein
MGVVQVTSCLSALGLEHHRGAAGAENEEDHVDWVVARATTPVTRRRRPASSHSQHTAESPALTPGRGRAVSRLLDDQPKPRPSRDDDACDDGTTPSAAQLYAALKPRLGSRAPIPVRSFLSAS